MKVTRTKFGTVLHTVEGEANIYHVDYWWNVERFCRSHGNFECNELAVLNVTRKYDFWYLRNVLLINVNISRGEIKKQIPLMKVDEVL